MLYRKLADKVAAEGYLVIVPDLLHGDYVDPHNPQFDRVAWKKVHTPVSLIMLREVYPFHHIMHDI